MLFTSSPARPSTSIAPLDVQEQLARQGGLHHRSVKVPDLVIAACAEAAGATLWHYDEDYDRIAEVTGQPAEWIASARFAVTRSRGLTRHGADDERVAPGARGPELPDGGREALHEVAVMRGHDHGTAEPVERGLEPLPRVQVEVVQRLVEQQDRRAARNQQRQRQSCALPEAQLCYGCSGSSPENRKKCRNERASVSDIAHSERIVPSGVEHGSSVSCSWAM